MNARTLNSSASLLRRRILSHLALHPAMGLAALCVAACGSSVTVEEDGDDGAGATGATGVGAAGGTGAGAGPTGNGGEASGGSSATGGVGNPPFVCDVAPPAFGELVYQCASSPVCPPANSQQAIELLYPFLGWSECSEACCWGDNVTSVPCGPDPGAQQCCYYAVVEPFDVCEGRPFVVEGEARTAVCVERADWAAARLASAGEGLDAATRAAIADAWASDGLYEHASVASFARFALELLAVGAPADLLRDAQRAMADEIDHAERCFALARRYGGRDVGPGSLSMEGAGALRTDLREVVLAVVREGCVGETVASLVAAAMRDAATDPEVRDALGRIADDEARHAELAWRTARWAIEVGGPEIAAAVREALARPELTVIAPAVGAGADRRAMRDAGRLDTPELSAIAERALAEVIRPCAEALLSAPAYSVSPEPSVSPDSSAARLSSSTEMSA